MHELLHYAAGARAPIVMANVNRTVASPWAFWPDQTDSLAQRDTGWIQYYVESAQEALDTVLQAYRVAEQVLVPAMVNLDAFYISHALEPVALPAQADVDAYLPPYDPPHRLDPARPEGWGNVITQDMFYRHRMDIEAALQRVPALAAEADREWATITGRSWGVVERYRCDGAQTLMITMGSMCGSAREAVDALREAGEAVGLVKLRLFRPLPVAALRAALAGASDVIATTRPAWGASCTRSCAPRCTAWRAHRASTACSPAWAESTCRPSVWWPGSTRAAAAWRSPNPRGCAEHAAEPSRRRERDDVLRARGLPGLRRRAVGASRARRARPEHGGRDPALVHGHHRRTAAVQLDEHSRVPADARVQRRRGQRHPARARCTGPA
jgi:hypothetical protein